MDQGNGSVKIFMYHRVVTEDTPFVLSKHKNTGTTVSRAVFASQIERLTQRYTIISLADALKILKNSPPIDRAYCVITFDDGYSDNYHNAFPVLQKFGATATFFIMGGCLAGSGYVRWLDEYYYMLDQTTVTAALMHVKGDKFPRLISPRGRWERRLTHLVRQWPYEDKAALIAALRSALKVDVPHNLLNSQLYLSAPQIQEMHRAGMTIGAHTMTHPFALGQQTAETARQEVTRSVDVVRELTHQAFVPFAYPWGDRASYNRDIMTLLDEIGSECAVTTAPGNNTAGAPLFELKRIAVYESSELQ